MRQGIMHLVNSDAMAVGIRELKKIISIFFVGFLR